MLIFIVLVSFIIFIIAMAVVNKVKIREKRIGLIILLINISVMLFSKIVYPMVWQCAERTITFYISVIINITIFVILLLKSTKVNKRVLIGLIVMYFICMIFLPVYKIEGHEHDFSQENEVIKSYVDYYNCYSIRIKRVYE